MHFTTLWHNTVNNILSNYYKRYWLILNIQRLHTSPSQCAFLSGECFTVCRLLNLKFHDDFIPKYTDLYFVSFLDPSIPSSIQFICFYTSKTSETPSINLFSVIQSTDFFLPIFLYLYVPFPI